MSQMNKEYIPLTPAELKVLEDTLFDKLKSLKSVNSDAIISVNKQDSGMSSRKQIYVSIRDKSYKSDGFTILIPSGNISQAGTPSRPANPADVQAIKDIVNDVLGKKGGKRKTRKSKKTRRGRKHTRKH